MATRLGQAFVTISAQLAQLKTDLAQAKAETSAAIASMQQRADSLHFKAAVSSLSSLSTAAVAAGAAFAGLTAAAGVIGTKFNASIESSTVGIASLLAAQGKFTDSQGRELQGREKINAALGMSSDLVKQLQVDNLKTTATFEQLINAFQVTLSPGLSKGLDVNQVRQYTLAMVQAAAAMQVPLDQMAEETRSLLEGTITPRNTRIATALGITGEDVRKWQDNASGWFTWVMGKLQAFSEFGGIQATTYGGLMSNASDAVSNILGKTTQPFFEDLKGAVKEFYDYAVKVDEQTGKIALNPELLNSVQALNDGLRLTLDIVKTTAAGLSALGTAYTSIKNALPSGAPTYNSTDAFSFYFPSNADQRLASSKLLIDQITTLRSALKDMDWGDYTRFLQGPRMQWELSSKVDELARLRDEMAASGQDVSKLDAVLKVITVDSDALAAAEASASGEITKVGYAAGNAINDLDKFKKYLQEIGQIDLSNIGKSLETSITELNAKIKAAQAGVKPGLQGAVADYAKTVAQLDLKEWHANNIGATPEVLAGIKNERSLAAQEYWAKEKLFQANESNSASRKGGGSAPVGFAQIDQNILRFKERVDKLYREIDQVNSDYEAKRLEASGQFYAAEEIRMNQHVADQKAAYAREVADTQQAYTEMEQKLGGKKGSTPEAQAALDALRSKLEGLKSVQEQYNNAVDNAAQQTLSLAERQRQLQGRIELSQVNVSYAELTGTMEEQLKAQMALIAASREEKITNASKDIPGLAEAYRKLYDEQERVARINASGSWMEGFNDEARKIGRELETPAMQGRNAMRSLQHGIEDAADALAEFCVTGKMDFGNFAQSIIKDLIKIQIEGMLKSSVFGGGSAGGGILSGIMGLFGLGGGGGSSFSVASWRTASPTFESSSLMMGGWHTGGVVGYDAPSFTRNVPASTFANARRFHSGLAPDEFPAILQRGERVIPKSKTSGSSVQVVMPTVKIVNPPGQKNEVESATLQRDGEEMILAVVLKGASNSKKFRDGLFAHAPRR